MQNFCFIFRKNSDKSMKNKSFFGIFHLQVYFLLFMFHKSSMYIEKRGGLQIEQNSLIMLNLSPIQTTSFFNQEKSLH